MGLEPLKEWWEKTGKPPVSTKHDDTDKGDGEEVAVASLPLAGGRGYSETLLPSDWWPDTPWRSSRVVGDACLVRPIATPDNPPLGA